MDNLLTGGKHTAHTVHLEEEICLVAGKGSFDFKPAARNSDNVDPVKIAVSFGFRHRKI